MPERASSGEVNGRRHAWPQAPVVVACIDGSEPAYMEQAVAGGHMPWLAAALPSGSDRRARCVVPSFTNPNNLSIVTGAPPMVHGICGNYLYDVERGVEVMMNDPRFLRAPTLFQAFQDAGARIVIITAKDKLRRLLGHGLRFGRDGAVCFSSEKADEVTAAEHGIEGVVARVGMAVPSVYSAELSEFVFAASVALMQDRRPDLMYLSTTDYIQHKHAPGTPVANAFYRMMDTHLARLDALGAVLVLTADHGMKDKHDTSGQPNVVYLQTLFDDWLGEGIARVILPITDPYVVHHGALGGYATVYLPARAALEALRARLAGVHGIELVLTRDEACARFELPPDRVGDLMVLAEADRVLGTRPERHDLSQLEVPLRSHGGLSEQVVPMVINRRLADVAPDAELRNFDAFDLALNHCAGSLQRDTT